jgi:hypothetical protein
MSKNSLWALLFYMSKITQSKWLWTILTYWDLIGLMPRYNLTYPTDTKISVVGSGVVPHACNHSCLGSGDQQHPEQKVYKILSQPTIQVC